MDTILCLLALGIVGCLAFAAYCHHMEKQQPPELPPQTCTAIATVPKPETPIKLSKQEEEFSELKLDIKAMLSTVPMEQEIKAKVPREILEHRISRNLTVGQAIEKRIWKYVAEIMQRGLR